jgi:hypothetical protein
MESELNIINVNADLEKLTASIATNLTVGICQTSTGNSCGGIATSRITVRFSVASRTT